MSSKQLFQEAKVSPEGGCASVQVSVHACVCSAPIPDSSCPRPVNAQFDEEHPHAQQTREREGHPRPSVVGGNVCLCNTA